MSSFVSSLLAFIVAISVLVAVHEFGHFWVAKKLGIKVLRFSIGFGTPFWSRKFGADRTEFALAAIPLGGYVKMLDEREGPVEAHEVSRAFNQQSLSVRSAVLVAGPLFNFIFAIFAYWLMFVSGINGLRPVIGEVEPTSIAASAGFQYQDELLQVGERLTPNWDAAMLELLDAALDQSEINVLVRSKDQQERLVALDFSDTPDVLDKGGLLKNLGIGLWRPEIPAVIDRLIDGKPAQLAGLMPGDRVVKADEHIVNKWSDWVDYIRARPGTTIRVTVQRASNEVVLEMTPSAVASEGETIGQIGAYVRAPDEAMKWMRVEVQYGPLEAVGKSVAKTWEVSTLTLRTLWSMVTGGASIENISGPISIAQYAGYSAKTGLSSFLGFLAVVSVSLGVLNLLPIPILDGGHLLYNAIEWIRGVPMSEAGLEAGQKLGIAALLCLMSVAFYNDLSRLFGGP